MNGPSFANQTITCLSPGSKTVHGKIVDDWTTETPLVIAGCSVQPGQGSDNADHRDTQLVQWTALVFDLELGARLTDPAEGFRRVRFAGLDLRIVGTPLPQIYGLSSDHIQLNLSAWAEV